MYHVCIWWSEIRGIARLLPSICFMQLEKRQFSQLLFQVMLISCSLFALFFVIWVFFLKFDSVAKLFKFYWNIGAKDGYIDHMNCILLYLILSWSPFFYLSIFKCSSNFLSHVFLETQYNFHVLLSVTGKKMSFIAKLKWPLIYLNQFYGNCKLKHLLQILLVSKMSKHSSEKSLNFTWMRERSIC